MPKTMQNVEIEVVLRA